MAWVLDHSPTRATDRLVLLSIANHAGKDAENGAWEAWPGIACIQREARLDRERTVQDALARLVRDGAIERIINGAPDMRIRADQRPNLYRILLSHGVTPNDTPAADARGDARRRNGVTRGDVTGCRPASPKPIDEPSLNQRSARAPAADAAALPGMPLAPEPSRPMTERIIAEIREARSPCPVERLSPRLVGQLLSAGWTEAEVRAALMSAPAWSPGSIQVELQRQTGRRRGAEDRPTAASNPDMRGSWAFDG